MNKHENTAASKLDRLNALLADLGYRLCGEGERGWYVTVQLDGKLVKVWATDAPKEVSR